eukprot:11349774-Alexandrium_andersonii.AAC.1
MGQPALSAARNLQNPEPHLPEARAGSALWGSPTFCRFRAAERAGWPVGRAGTATSRAGF